MEGVGMEVEVGMVMRVGIELIYSNEDTRKVFQRKSGHPKQKYIYGRVLHMFTEFKVLFELDDARKNEASDLAKLCQTNRDPHFGPTSEEAAKWRHCLEEDRNRIAVLERIIEKKKAYLFG